MAEQSIEMTASSQVVISFEVDTSETSSMFCCMICQELIQCADDHRQCASRPGGDGCGGTICMPCIGKLDKRHCPICGDKYPGVFVACQLIKKIIYPRVSSKCPLGCGRSFLTQSQHVSECEHRIVACPVCDHGTKVDDIFTHLNADCKFPWATCDVTSPAQWDDAMISICANPVDTNDKHDIMCLTRINPKGESMVRKNNRMIYAWREGDLVKLFCIQLSAAAGETQRLGFDDDQDAPVTCGVNSYATFPGAIEMPTKKFLGLDISLGSGPWNLIMGMIYDVPTGENNDPMIPDFIARNFRGIGTFRGKLLDVLWGPPRGVFINHLGQTYMAHLDTQTASEIKLAPRIQSRQMMRRPVELPHIENAPPSMVANQLFNAIRVAMSGLPPGRVVASGIISGSGSEVKVERESKNELPADNMDEKNDANNEDEDDEDDDSLSSDNESVPDLETPAPSAFASEVSARLETMLSGEPMSARELRRPAIAPGEDAEIAALNATHEHIMRQIDDDMMQAAIIASLEDMM